MAIDPRLAERRRTVSEDRAKRNVARLLKFLAGVVVLGTAIWLAYSPWLSVDRVETVGISNSDAHRTLVDHGVVAGTPMFKVDSVAATVALESDPWIAEATVLKHWPDRIAVEITERVPIAWTRTDAGWTRRAVDGVAIPSGPVPAQGMAQIDMGWMSETVSGEAAEMLGALEFIAALPTRLHEGTVVSEFDGEMWASVSGFQVRLGRPVEMAAKARSLAALLREQLAEGSVLILIAPTNPAVQTPEGVEVDEDPATEGEATGDD